MRVQSASQEGSLHHPPDTGESDQDGAGDDDELPVFLLTRDPEGRGKGERDDGELAKLHSDVDPEQTDDERRGRVEPGRHHAGKSETVDKTENEDDEEPPMTVVPPDNVFDGNEDDARGNDRLDDPGRELYPAGRGHPEGDGVGEGEGGDLKNEGLPFAAH